ncbi:MAG: kinase/pyrophosphorylase, partial [Hyphomicrobium sp.]
AEIAHTRRICAKYRWPVIDVTRRSIEESAATIIKLLNDQRAQEAQAVHGSDG